MDYLDCADYYVTLAQMYTGERRAYYIKLAKEAFTLAGMPQHARACELALEGV